MAARRAGPPAGRGWPGGGRRGHMATVRHDL